MSGEGDRGGEGQEGAELGVRGGSEGNAFRHLRGEQLGLGAECCVLLRDAWPTAFLVIGSSNKPFCTDQCFNSIPTAINTKHPTYDGKDKDMIIRDKDTELAMLRGES